MSADPIPAKEPLPQGAVPLSKQRLRLWLKLLKAQAAIEGALRRRLRDTFDTTLPRFDVMSALARYPDGLRMSEISALLKVSNGNVTGIVDRLVQDGLAVRVAVPGDKRAQIARLTRAGLVAFDDYAKAHEAWLDEMLGGMQTEDLAVMGRVLDRLKRHLEDNNAQ